MLQMHHNIQLLYGQINPVINSKLLLTSNFAHAEHKQVNICSDLSYPSQHSAATYFNYGVLIN